MAAAARYEYKEGPGMPVVFRAKQYSSASDALSAYISDFEGRETRHRGAKYETELMTLFCPQYQPAAPRAGNSSLGGARPGKSRREQELEKLVQQAYDQLRRLKESKKVEESMSASSRLLEKLDHDRLPSPTRSTILAPSGRPSTDSVTTDALLDARPLDFSAPYSQQPHSHSNKSLLESLDLNTSEANSFRTHTGPYQLKGMNELMSSIRSEKELLSNGGKSLSGDSLTVNDLLTSGNNTRFDASRRSHLTDSSLRKEDFITTSQLGNIRQRLTTEYPFTAEAKNPLANSWNGTLSDNEKSTRLMGDKMVTREKHAGNPYSALPNGVSRSAGDVDALLNDSWNRRDRSYQSDRSRNSADMNKSRSESRSNSFQKPNTTKPGHKSRASKHSNRNPPSALPAYLTAEQGSQAQGQMNGHMNGSYVDRSVVSGATDSSSSIISGHLLKGKRKQGVSKVVSTPKRNTHAQKSNSKQLRFDLDKSRLGHSLDSRDISAHSKSLDLSNIDKVSVERPDFSFGRKAVISILKPQSPGKKRGPGSRVSFTTDDLIQADASGLAGMERQPRSKSLPRPRDMERDQSHNAFHYEEYSGYSGASRGRTESRESPLRSTSRARTVQGYAGAPAGAPAVGGPGGSEVKQGRYRQFLEGLMREIEDSSSSVPDPALPRDKPLATPNHSFQHAPAQEGPGFLARVKELLTSPPSVTQYMNGSSTAQDDSLSTDAVLDGDRSWERIVPFKAPTEVSAEERKDKTRFEKFMEDCMAEADGTDKTLTGSSQPGALETLKNMMFKMQSFSEPQPTQDDTLEDSVHLPLDDSVDKLLSPETKRLLSKSYSTQPGGPCLAKAMEHLTKLKDLVDHKDGQ